MLDLESAFDNVSRVKLFSQLHKLQIRPAVIQLLTHWHNNTQYHFQHGCDTVALPIGAGLRQGCKAAPGLWSFLLLLYLQQVTQHIPIAWLRHHLNIYADDYQVGGIFYSVDDLRLLLKAFGILLQTLNDFSLRINPKKSAALLAIAGTSHRHQRAQFMTTKNKSEQLRIPLPDGDEIQIPIQPTVTYLGTIMTYKDCSTATLKHRLCLARNAQRRLGRWLRGKHDFKVLHRFRLWRSTVFPVLTYGIFSTGITTHGITILQKEMYKMLRQVACDHAFRTGHNNQQALSLAGLPTPLQLLRAAAQQLLRSITQRMSLLHVDDIALQLPWSHLEDLVIALNSTQDLCPRLVEPAVSRVAPSDTDTYHCNLCAFIANDVATLRRHCTTAHGQMVTRHHFAAASQFTQTGLPECKYCGRIFTTWRRFQVHIERGCQVLYTGPCAIEPKTVQGVHAYMTGTALAAGEFAVRHSTMIPETELSNLRGSPFGLALCQIIEQRDWDRLAELSDACQYLAKRCILCGLHYNRVQELNAHYRTMHGQYWEGVPQRAVYMSNTWATERPCPYCGALFKSHLCPVWVQVAALLLYGVGVPHDAPDIAEAPSPSLRCEVCLEQFSDLASLTEHLRNAHALQGVAFNVARDSVAGSPACAHCGALYDSMCGLRSHINQGRCLEFRADATAETLPMHDDWLQACLGGKMKIILTNSQRKLALTLHCQLCGVRYARATDLSCHLQGSHARVWRCSQQLTLILVSLFYSNGTCVCNPALHQNRLDHVCMPLRHLAMLFSKMDNQLFAPFQAEDTLLRRLLSRMLDQPTRHHFDQIAAQHDYARMWQDTQSLITLRSQCLLCGHECAASALSQHVREAHPCNLLALPFYIAQLVPLMLTHQQVDYQCYACLQIFNLPVPPDMAPDPERQKLAQSHLLYNCPCLLQIALFLTGLLHDGHLNAECDRSAGTTAGAGNLQGPGAPARISAAVPQSKRAKTQQTPARGSTDAGPAEPSGSPDTTTAATHHLGSAARSTGPTTRPRSQPKPQSRQLRAFFQPRSQGRLTEPVDGYDQLAGATKSVHNSDDDAAAAPDTVSVSGPHGEGAQDLRSQAGGPTISGLCPEPADRCRGQLAVSGMGSKGQTTDDQHQDTNQYDSDDSARQRTGGDVQESGLGDGLPIPSDNIGGTDLPLETSTLSQSRQGMGTPQQDESQQRVDPPGYNAQTTCIDPMWTGGHHSEVPGTSTTQREREGQTQIAPPADGPEVSPQLTILLHVLSHLRLRNNSNWCYANSTIFSLLWSLMSMQCDSASLGIRFAELIQFLPCHNLQSVALTDLRWFQQILQNWDAFAGDQWGRQQDASEFATAVLTWLQAPAVNMTWERRVEEMNAVTVHDHGNAFMPITVYFPDTHAHLPDTQFTLTHLLRRWMQEHGMIAALQQAPQCICVHLDRFLETEGHIQKSQCLIDMEAGCDVQVFTDQSLRRESVGYVLTAATAHLGDAHSGHFRAALKTRPAVLQNGQPMHWLITNDDSEARPIWLVPDWFRSNTNLFWLLRSDCVQLHTYQALPTTVQEPTETSPEIPSELDADPLPEPDSHAVTIQMPPQDETTAAIMALLQATSMAERQR